MTQIAPIDQSVPKRQRVKSLSMRLPFDIHDDLVKAAEEHERSLAGEIRWVLRRYADDPTIFEEG